MGRKDQCYINLQKHLDRQAVGFPATGSGVEIRILKRIFTPREAEVAARLNHKPEPIEPVFKRCGDMIETAEDLEKVLDRIREKGGIEITVKDGQKHYCNLPFLIGIYELQVGSLNRELVKDLDEYTSNKKFGLEILSTELPQIRTIPVDRSIRVENNVSTFDEVTELLHQADAPFVILECICRKKKMFMNELCKVTSRDETCLAMGSIGNSVLQTGAGREITREEALSILAKNQKEGLVIQPSNTQKADFICSCCGCCCGILSTHKKLPKPLEFFVSNFHSAVDKSVCTGCGVCELRCQVSAVKVPVKKQPALVDLNRCLGCGVCKL